MRRLISSLILMGFLLVMSLGCASRDYVKQQTEPLVDRISKLEAMYKECCEKSGSAAERSEAAAKKAETAAEKAKKSFELHQMK